MKGVAALREEKAFLQVKNLPLPVTIIIGGVPSFEKLNALTTLLHTPEKVAKVLVGGSFVQPFHRVLGHNTEIVRDRFQHEKEGETDTSGALNMDYLSHAAIRLGLKRVPLSVAPTPPGPLFRPAREGRNASYEAIPSDSTCVDIGTQTIAAFCNEVSSSKSILMCGTMGMCDEG
eukprot:gene31880-35986_t